MADTTTPNYALTKVQIGGSRDTWGDKLNDNLDKIDTALKAAKDKADNALPKSGGVVTDKILANNCGAFLFMRDAGHANAAVSLGPAGGASPLINPGDIWLGY